MWRKNTERYNSKVIEQSKEIYRNAIINEVIPELNEEKNEEISIDTLKELEDTLEQKIEDLDNEVSSTEDVKERKALRTKRSEINRTKNL